VEITGALAGLTFAFGNSSIVITTGLILGLIMTLSVTSTEYLAAKSGFSIKNPLKSVIYAGFANIFTVVFLLLPYLLIENIFIALGVTISIAIIIIFLFSFYLSVTRDTSTRRIFLEMASVSLGIAALAFAIGHFAKEFLHIHVI
jgi:VIT1/CCC1 family predicted Fe2+/Mn2+ transporter